MKRKLKFGFNRLIVKKKTVREIEKNKKIRFSFRKKKNYRRNSGTEIAEIKNDVTKIQVSVFSSSDLIRPSLLLKKTIESFFLDLRSDHTRKSYSKDLKRFIQYLLVREMKEGSIPIDRHLIIRYKDWLLSEKLSPASVDRHLSFLRSFFAILMEDGHIPVNIAAKVRYINQKKTSSTNAFSDAEVVKILSLPNLHTKSGAQHYAILMVLFYCGLRRSEVCDLMTNSIFSERKMHAIRLMGKGNKERIIPLREEVYNAISYHMMMCGKRPDVQSPLFTPVRNNRSGDVKKKLDSSTIYFLVKKYASLCGIKTRVSPHSCRATAISNARDHHVPDRAIQEFAGWSSPLMITHYDKRKTALEESATHSIQYKDEL